MKSEKPSFQEGAQNSSLLLSPGRRGKRTITSFTKLNEGWNAEPGAPDPELSVQGRTLILTFYLNPWVFQEFKLGDVGELTFSHCWRYRLGSTNDEGWWRGHCRFSRRALEWGEFYEVDGDLRLETPK